MKKYIKFGNFYLFNFSVDEKCSTTDFIEKISFSNIDASSGKPYDFSTYSTEFIASLLEKLTKLFNVQNICAVDVKDDE